MKQLTLTGVAPPPLHAPEGREALDRYYTPVRLATACCWALLEQAEVTPLSIVEPGVGGGAWVGAARAVWGQHPLLWVADLDPSAPGLQDPRVNRADVGEDYLEAPLKGCHLVLGNPPYVDAQAWVERALLHSVWVAFLLRGTFLGSVGRRPWFEAHRPRMVWTVSPRPQWEGPGARDQTDTMDPVLILWDSRDLESPTELRWLGW